MAVQSSSTALVDKIAAYLNGFREDLKASEIVCLSDRQDQLDEMSRLREQLTRMMVVLWLQGIAIAVIGLVVIFR